MTSLARLGPVSTPAGWPGTTSATTSVIRLSVPCSTPLVRLTTGTSRTRGGAASAWISRTPGDGNPVPTASALTREPFVIAQLSDLHCGSPYFDAKLLEAAVDETIGMAPDLVVIGGDLTAEGYAGEFRTAQTFLEPLFAAGLRTLVIPGNHDSKNVGYLHFRDTFGVGDVADKG